MLYTNETDKLFIVFKDNTKKIKDNVSAYDLLSDHKFFYFDGEGVRSFIPAESVLYFGSLEAWGDEHDEKNNDNIVNKLREYIDRLKNAKDYLSVGPNPMSDIQVNILTNVINDLQEEILGERD